MPLNKPDACIANAKAEMARRGWKVSHLAARAGYKPKTITNVLCGDNVAWEPRAAINKAFGKKIFHKTAATPTPQSL
ncbi:MAG: hypothetical protein ABIR24_11320 [Verrucomicrobiota bacterium]